MPAPARLLLLGLLASSCADDEAAGGVPWPVVPFPEMVVPADNPTTAEKVELGRLLFHDPVLSSDRQVACVTCHGQIWGFSDGLPRSIGIGGTGPAGTGRTGPTQTRRNSSTVWNAAYRQGLFWDGRAATLEDQVRFPMADATELGRSADEVAGELATIPAYVPLFAAAFPDEPAGVTASQLVRAIAAFERTIVSDRAPYDRYVAGDTLALGESSRRGLVLFAELGCPSCHAPPLFESDRYEAAASELTATTDHGRAEVTGAPADERRFRVPTLRNLRDTAPYFHDGSVHELEDAVALEARLRARELAPTELADLAELLRKGLMDRAQEPLRPTEVPSGLPVPQDGYRIPR